jgi:phenolic acid decarboxylase
MLSSLFLLDIKPPYKQILWYQEDFIDMPENYREKEPLYNAGNGNTLAEMGGNTYTVLTGNAMPKYACIIGARKKSRFKSQKI